MTPQTKTPPERSGAGGVQNTSRRSHFTKKLPYANQLSLFAGACLVVCTGRGAWDRGKSSTWFPGCKVVLPFGDDPAAYTWSAAAGHDVMVAGFGDLEPIGTIAKLAGLLLAAGAGLVLYAPEKGPVTRIEARRAAA